MKKITLCLAVITLTFIVGFSASGESTYALEPQNNQVTPAAIADTSVSILENKITKGTVKATSLNVRENPGTTYKILGKLPNGAQIVVLETQGEWYKIQYYQLNGWVHSNYVVSIETKTETEWKNDEITRGSLLARTTPGSSLASETASQIIIYANKFLGTPYKYGTSGPSSFDCSGFVKYVFTAFGIDVPRSSKDYKGIGTGVLLKDILPGDIVCFDTSGPINGLISHVGIYIGDGQFIHAASGSSDRVRTSSIYDDYHSKRLVHISRVL